MTTATERPMGEMQVCPVDGEPVVFTFEFAGAEYVCVVCGWLGGVGAPSLRHATDARQRRHVELLDRYEAERAARLGLPAPRPRAQTAEPPTCQGCGTTATGPLVGDKPSHWFSRTISGKTEYACSRQCIGSGLVFPW